MLETLTMMMIAVSVLATLLIIKMMADIYNPDHPLNQNRTDQD